LFFVHLLIFETGEDIYQRNLALLKKQEGVTLVDLGESNKPNQRRVRAECPSMVSLLFFEVDFQQV
jgi:hypothetical protein